MSRTPVALVTPSFATAGGTATLTSFLFRTLAASGRYDPHVISLATSASDGASVQLRRPSTWKRGPVVETIEWHGIQFHQVGAWWAEFEPCRYRPRQVLRELLAPFPIVQVVAGTSASALAVLNVPGHVCLWTATSERGDRYSVLRRGPLGNRLWRGLMTHAAEAAERRVLTSGIPIFALSSYTLRSLSERTPALDIRIAPCGVDTDLFQPGIAAEPGYLVSVARFNDPRKNLQMLLKAYRRLLDMCASPPELWLVGESPSAGGVRLISELGLGEHVRVMGVRPEQELARILAGARMFLLSSDEEGLGLALLEGMAAGLPAVSTRCGGPEDLVVEGVTGRLVDVGHDEAFATAIRESLSAPGFLASAAVQARKRAVEHFSLRVCGDRFLAHYDTVLNRSMSSPC